MFLTSCSAMEPGFLYKLIYILFVLEDAHEHIKTLMFSHYTAYLQHIKKCSSVKFSREEECRQVNKL